MELLGSPIVPAWTNYSYPSLTSRPLLTVHRSRYLSIPRLFPADVDVYRVVSPSASLTAHEKLLKNNGPLTRLESTFNSLSLGHHPSSENVSTLDAAIWVGGPGEATIPDPCPVTEPGVTNGSSHADAAVCKFATSPLGKIVPRVSRALPLSRIRNTTATVAVGDKLAAVFCPVGSLSAVTLCTASDESSTRLVRHLVEYDPSTLSSLRLPPVVTSVASRDADGDSTEPARLAFGMRDSIQLANYEGGLDIAWGGEVLISGALYSSEFNMKCREELLTLCEDGVMIHPLDAVGTTISVAEGFDVWHERAHAHYFAAHFAAHPRVALLGSSAGLHRADMRCRASSARSCEARPLFNVWRNWSMSQADGGLKVFERHPFEPFWSIVGSDHLLAVVDERMPCNPLLTWSLTGSPLMGPTLSCVRSVSPSDVGFGLAIALATPKDGSLSLFHLHSGEQARQGCFSPGVVVSSRSVTKSAAKDTPVVSTSESMSKGSHSTSSGPVGTRHAVAASRAIQMSISDFPLPPLLWSDLPLGQLPTYAPTEGLVGLALLPHPKINVFSCQDRDESTQAGACLSLLQVSASGEAISQLVGCNSFEDGDHAFEAHERRMVVSRRDRAVSKERSHEQNADPMDTTIALREAQFVFSSQPRKERIMLRANDGVHVVQKTKRLPALGAIDLRRRIVSGDGDETHGDNWERATDFVNARPFLFDRPLLSRIQGEKGVQGDSDADTDICLDSMEEFLGMPRTTREVLAATRVGNPHSKTNVSAGSLVTKLEQSPLVECYSIGDKTSEVAGSAVRVFTTWRGTEACDNQLTEVILGSPFAEQLAKLEDIFYKGPSAF